MKVSHSNHFEKFGLPPRTRSWPMSISSLHIEDEQVTGWLHPATSLPSIGLELSGFLVSPIITLISCFFWFMPIQNLRNRILKHQALANGVHPDVDFEGNQLPYWMAQMANKPIAGGEDQTLIFLCSSRTISYDFVSPQSVRQESFPVHTLPSCTYTTSPFLRWPCSAGGVEGRLEVYPRSLLSPLPLGGKRDMSSVCCQKNHWSKQKRQESWIDVYISFCFFLGNKSSRWKTSDYQFHSTCSRWTNLDRTFPRRSDKRALVDCFKVPHPILGLEGFQVYQLRFCSMHIVNLGILQNVTASCITLLCQHGNLGCTYMILFCKLVFWSQSPL